MKFPKENIIDNWLNDNGNPEVSRLVKRNLAIADRVSHILKEKNINRSTFAEMLGKKPSEITKWLSGTHNLTMKSVGKMEAVLDVDLLQVVQNIQPILEKEYVYLGMIKGGLRDAINDYEETVLINEFPENGYDIAIQ
jgi:transcriptional regulator with XRE-family HTH domain